MKKSISPSGGRTLVAFPRDGNKSFNPYTHIVYAALEKYGWFAEDFREGKTFFHPPDVFHIHWLEPYYAFKNPLESFFSALKLVILLERLVSKGTKIVWTMHNLASHEKLQPSIERFLQNFVARKASAIVTLSEAGVELGRKRFPFQEDKFFALPHPHYRDYYREKMLSRVEARQKLGLPEKNFIFLFAGQIRPYKGVLELIESFKNLDPAAKGHCLLVVAGKASDASYLKEIEAALGENKDVKNILFFHRYLEEEDLLAFVAASDVGVLPYRDVLNSGSALLYSSLGIPVVGPKIGALPEVMDALREGVLYDPQEKNALRDSLFEAFERYRVKEVREEIIDLVEASFSPDRIGRLHAELYAEIEAPKYC